MKRRLDHRPPIESLLDSRLIRSKLVLNDRETLSLSRSVSVAHTASKDLSRLNREPILSTYDLAICDQKGDPNSSIRGVCARALLHRCGAQRGRHGGGDRSSLGLLAFRLRV